MQLHGRTHPGKAGGTLNLVSESSKLRHTRYSMPIRRPEPPRLVRPGRRIIIPPTGRVAVTKRKSSYRRETRPHFVDENFSLFIGRKMAASVEFIPADEV